MSLAVFTSSLVFLWGLLTLATGTYVDPSTFLESRLAKGSWIDRKDIEFDSNLFEGGWVWTAKGNLKVTHVCRAKSFGHGLNSVAQIEPGELLNGTCYISGSPSLISGSLSGVQAFHEYQVLMKVENEVYEWMDFDRENGSVPNGAVIGGIGGQYEPILVCRKFFNSSAGDLRKSKAVLGKFSPRDGKCFFEMELGTGWIKWDGSLATESFQLLVLRGRSKEQCAEAGTT